MFSSCWISHLVVEKTVSAFPPLKISSASYSGVVDFENQPVFEP
jgi:hypothetical protein